MVYVAEGLGSSHPFLIKTLYRIAGGIPVTSEFAGRNIVSFSLRKDGPDPVGMTDVDPDDDMESAYDGGEIYGVYGKTALISVSGPGRTGAGTRNKSY